MSINTHLGKGILLILIIYLFRVNTIKYTKVLFAKCFNTKLNINIYVCNV